MAENLDTTPALRPPPGITPNFDDPESVHDVQIIIGSICLALCVIAVSCRTFARAKILKKFDFNDAALLLSIAIMATYVALTIYTGNYGQGIHQWNVSVSHVMKLLKIINTLQILYGPMMFLAKYVVLRQIESIFLQHKRGSLSEKGVLFLIWGNLAFYVALMISFICACIPREKIWNPTLPGRCIDDNATLIASSAINIVSDVTILVLPLAVLWTLQMPLKSKFRVIAIFSIGIFANVASVVRFYYTLVLVQSVDATYAVEPFAYWTHIEFTTVVIVACAPLFPPLFRYIRHGDKPQPYSSSKGTTIGSKSRPRATALDEHSIRDGHSSVENLRDYAGYGVSVDSRGMELREL